MAKWGRPSACGSCGECEKCERAAYMREWYAKRTFEERRELRAGRNIELTRQRDRERHARKRGNPELYEQQRAAVRAANNAVRDGRLTREPCEVCGADAQGHHDDYSKPLDVRWLCTQHHAEHHKEINMATVRTGEGELVHNDVKIPLTTEQAEASAADRNTRAEALGIQTRYVVADD